jgi:hypothetical protein
MSWLIVAPSCELGTSAISQDRAARTLRVDEAQRIAGLLRIARTRSRRCKLQGKGGSAPRQKERTLSQAAVSSTAAFIV